MGDHAYRLVVLAKLHATAGMTRDEGEGERQPGMRPRFAGLEKNWQRDRHSGASSDREKGPAESRLDRAKT
jgi:hypothetical protein